MNELNLKNSKFLLSLIVEKSITSSLQLWRVARVIEVFILVTEYAN